MFVKDGKAGKTARQKKRNKPARKKHEQKGKKRKQKTRSCFITSSSQQEKGAGQNEAKTHRTSLNSAATKYKQHRRQKQQHVIMLEKKQRAGKNTEQKQKHLCIAYVMTKKQVERGGGS